MNIHTESSEHNDNTSQKSGGIVQRDVASSLSGGRHGERNFIEKLPHLSRRTNERRSCIDGEHCEQENGKDDDGVDPIGNKSRLDTAKCGVNEHVGNRKLALQVSKGK